MIYIEKNTTNDICLNLSEVNILNMPYYIFEFISEWTTMPTPEDSIYFYTPDISSYTNRYNEFTLIDDEVTGSINGGNDIPLNLKSGQYKYNIYISSTSSIVPSTFGNIVDTGRMLVTGTNSTVDYRYL